MPPLDALTQQRIRSLEIVVSWLIEQHVLEATDPDFHEAAMSPTYILELAEKIQEAREAEEDE